MKNIYFTLLMLISLFVGKETQAQYTVDAGSNQTFYCTASAQLKATVPFWKDKSTNINGSLKAIEFYGDTIIGATSNLGIYKSINNGVSWQSVSSTYNEHRAIAKASSNTFFTAGYYSADNKGRIFKTTDGGSNWSLIVDEGSKEYWDIDTYNDTVWAVGVNRGTWTGRLNRSPNLGTSWVEQTGFTTGAFNTPYAIVVTFSKVFIGTSNGVNGAIQYSLNRGTTFSTIDTTSNGLTFPGVYDLNFVSDSVGFASCLNGVILKTTNGGLSWAMVYNNASLAALNVINFKTPQIGFAAGNTGSLIKTIDAGQNWTDVSQGSGFAINCLKSNNYVMYAATGNYSSSSHLYIEKSYLYSWNHASMLNNSTIPNPIATVPLTTTFTVTVSDESNFVATDDVIINVNPLEIKAYNSQNILPGESVNLFVAIDTSQIGNYPYSFQWSPSTGLQTPNAQSTKATPTQNTTYYVTTTINGNNCAADSVTITIVSPTVDAGNNVTIQYGGSASLGQVTFDECMIKKTGFSSPNFSSVKFFSSKLGYLTSPTSKIVLKTTDGGNGWKPVLKLSSNIKTMFFHDSLHGAVGTESGSLYFTNNGGNTWTNNYLFGTAVWSIFYASQDTIYASTVSGQMKKSTNGGTVWSTVTTGTSNDIEKLFFLNGLTGFATFYATSGSYVKKTIDGGTTWTYLGGNFNSTEDIYFINQNVGFIVDYTSAKRTSDGGQTWSNIIVDGSMLTVTGMHSIDFINDSVGFIGSPFIKTTDGGLTWTKIETLNPPTYDLSAVNEHLIFGAGQFEFVRYLDPQFNWTPATYLDNATIKKPIFTPGETTKYTLNVSTFGNYSTNDSITVTVPDPCKAQVQYTVNQAANEVLLNTTLSQPPYTTSPFTFLWKFGDGTQSTIANPSHSFPAQGFQHVQFTAKSWNGCTVDTSFFVSIGNAAAIDCQAGFNYTIDHLTKTVNFTNTSLGNNITSNTWHFDDGQYSNVASPSHTYSQSGNYNVCLSIYSSTTNCYNTICKPMTVDTNGMKCKAHFVYLIDSATKTASFYNLSKNNTMNNWTFGDGQISTIVSPTHTYSTNGYYLTRLLVTDNASKDDYAEIVNIGMPATSLYSIFGFTLDGVFSKTGTFPVKFYAATNGTPAKYKWDFGDGKSDSLTNRPLHEYDSPGTYTVCLTVSDPISSLSFDTCRTILIQGIENTNSDLKCMIYPNPAQDYVFVKMNTANSKSFKLSLFDYTGRILFSKETLDENQIINLNAYNPGVYFIKVENGDENFTRKIILVK